MGMEKGPCSLCTPGRNISFSSRCLLLTTLTRCIQGCSYLLSSPSSSVL